jgi:hypothetical protein
MRFISLIILTLFLLPACNKRGGKQSNIDSSLSVKQKPSIPSADNMAIAADTTQTNIDNEKGIVEIDSALKEISRGEYLKFKSSYQTTCALDLSGFIKGLGLTIKTDCG